LVKKLVETTRYSLSTDAPKSPDRRHDERYVSLLRVGALVLDGRRELCLIRNISAGGMMIRPYSAVEPGTPVSVELKHGESVRGFAQWADKGLVGVAFDAPIDVLALLSPTGTQSRPRMPRIELSCSASLTHDGTRYRARVVNISQSGICLNVNSDLPINADVVIKLPSLAPAAGVVKWQEGDQFGIGFNRLFPVDEVMEFLKAQQHDLNRDRQQAAG
jgi:PilZ domain